MSVPDFVSDVCNVEQHLDSEWQTVKQVWQDDVARRFEVDIVEPYMRNFSQYIYGEGFCGMGLEQLLQQMEQHQQEMSSLTY